MTDERVRERNTQLINSLAGGDGSTADLDHAYALAYEELRSVARRLMQRERTDHVLRPTALVNEAYLKLFDVGRLSVSGRTHFMNIAARAMRQVLVDYARNHGAAKRGGGQRAVTLDTQGIADPRAGIDLLDLNEALERFGDLDPRAARVVELRIFGGLTMEEIAEQLGTSRRTAQKDWRIATMWLRREFARAAEG